MTVFSANVDAGGSVLGVPYKTLPQPLSVLSSTERISDDNEFH